MKWMLRRIVSATGIAACLSVLTSAQTIPLAAQVRDATPPAQASDDRAAISLSDDEVAFIRHEMRGLLASVRDILEASTEGDRARIIEAAKRAGMNGPEIDHIPKSLAPKLPMEFKKLGLATHRGFDQIAQDVQQNGALDAMPKQLGTLMNNCVGCHAAWRIVGQGK